MDHPKKHKAGAAAAEAQLGRAPRSLQELDRHVESVVVDAADLLRIRPCKGRLPLPSQPSAHRKKDAALRAKVPAERRIERAVPSCKDDY